MIGNILKNNLVVKRLVYIISYLIAMAFISACGNHNKKISIDQKELPIRIDGKLDFINPDGSLLSSIFIEIADTAQAQTKGLMERDSLDQFYGMLFVFQKIKVQKFRMLNTRIPLDIIFIDEDGCICNIVQNAAPMSTQTYQSSRPIKYTVEVQGNFTKRFKINENTCIQWVRFWPGHFL